MEQNRTEQTSGIKQQAKLPLFLEGRTVEDMHVGESRAVQTHAMVADANYDLWIIGAWKTYANVSEDHPVIIIRTEEGFDVDAELVEDDGWFPDKDLTGAEDSDGRKLFPVFGVEFKIPD